MVFFMSGVKTIIFDFDGTLADTRECIIETLNLILERNGFQKAQPKQVHRLIGLTLEQNFEALAKNATPAQIQKMAREYRRTYNRIAPAKTRLFRGVKETLEQLKAMGVKTAITTSKGLEGTKRILEATGILPLFDAIIVEARVKNKKPAPDIVKLAMKKLHAKPQETLVVGDTVWDIEMGKRAGTKTCGITHGNHPRKTLQRAKPDHIIDRITTLTKSTVPRRQNRLRPRPRKTNTSKRNITRHKHP